MEIINTLCWFILGLCFGSFYHVIGYRLPKNESILNPKHSYCPHCKHRLSALELIPIFSYLKNFGKCHYCKKKISPFYPIIELITAFSFAVSFHIFGYSYSFFIALVLSSLMSIILVSDTLYLIIPDEVLIVGGGLILLLSFLQFGWMDTLMRLFSGVVVFLGMYLLMIVGNMIFRKECLGGADIKLMFLSGFLLGPFLSLIVLFLSSCIALPIALILYIVNQEKMIAYGPFLMVVILAMFLSQITPDKILLWLL